MRHGEFILSFGDFIIGDEGFNMGVQRYFCLKCGIFKFIFYKRLVLQINFGFILSEPRGISMEG